MTLSRPGLRPFIWLLAIVLIFSLIFVLRDALLPFAAAFILAYLLYPPTEWLCTRGVNRSLASLFTIFLSFFVVIGLGLLLLPIIATQLTSLLNALPEYLRQLEDFARPMIERLQAQLQLGGNDKLAELAGNQAGHLASISSGLAGTVLSGGLQALNILSLLVITPIITFYVLRDWQVIVKTVDSLFPRYYYQTIKQLQNEMDASIAGFIRGQFLVCLILGGFYALGLTIAGLQFGFAIGVLAGFLSFIPYVGSLVGAVTSLGMAFAQYGVEDWPMIVVVAVIFGVGQFVEGNILSPKLVGSRVNLHAVWVMLALFVGGALFGFVGVLLAVPVAAIIGVLVRFAARQYRNSAFYDAPLGDATLAEGHDKPV